MAREGGEGDVIGQFSEEKRFSSAGIVQYLNKAWSVDILTRVLMHKFHSKDRSVVWQL